MTVIQSEALVAFFSWLATSSLQASVLICLILTVQAVLRNKLAPRWRYALWLLLLIRLALPWAPSSQWSVYNLNPFSRSNTTTTIDNASADAPLPQVRNPPELPDAKSPAVPEFSIASSRETGNLTDRANGNPIEWTVLARFIPLVWLTVALAVILRICLESLSLARAIRRQRSITNHQMLKLLENCKREMGVYSSLPVIETPFIRSPALFGLWRPRLLLPSGMIQSLGAEHLRHIILHELGHLKRHDIAIGWLVAVLQALHWFNPLVWYAFYRMRADRELACDASVLAHFQPEEKLRYGLTIVKLLESFSKRNHLPGLAGVLENKNLIKRRIEMITLFTTASGRWPTLAVFLIIVLGMLTLTNAQQPSPFSNLGAKVAKLDIDRAMLDDVVRIFGEPERYVWCKEEPGKDEESLQIETYKKEDLPSRSRYIADYGGGFRVFMTNGRIAELRFENSPHFAYQEKLRAGDSLDDALRIIGQPKETVTGAAKHDIFGKDGVLYRDIGGRKGYDYYLRKDKKLRVFFLDDKVQAIYLTRSDFLDAPEDAPPPEDNRDINALMARLDIDRAILDDLIRLFGKPIRYLWGNQIYKPEDLPFHDNYIADFGAGFNVFMRDGRIEEVRFEGNRQYLHKAALRVGNTLDEAIKFMGQPTETVTGKKNEFKDGVLYRDIDGRKGYAYYHRKDQHLRLWFVNDRLSSIYVTRSDYGQEQPPKDVKDIAQLRKDRPWIAETTTLSPQGHLQDKIDSPLANDPDVLGTWTVVDFVREKNLFVPGRQRWPGKLDFLNGLKFSQDGKLEIKVGNREWQKTVATWTKGIILHPNDHTASEYEIVSIDGKSFLFYQWKSGDYTIRYQKPQYYVLEKNN